jgi:hypothetical protein
LGKSWEAGITVNQMTFTLREEERLVEIHPDNQEENADLMINLSKGFSGTGFLRDSLGTESEIALAEKPGDVQLATFNFVNNQFSIPDTLLTGFYYGNPSYVGKGIFSDTISESRKH